MLVTHIKGAKWGNKDKISIIHFQSKNNNNSNKNKEDATSLKQEQAAI